MNRLKFKLNLRFPNLKYIFYLISMVMLSNGLLINFIFKGTPLNIWRQIIWLIGFYFTVEIIIGNYNRIRNEKYLWHLQVSIFILVIASIIAILVNEYNINRIILGWMFYLFGYSFLFLPSIVISQNKVDKFLLFSAVLGLIISLGLIIDGLYPQLLSFIKLSSTDAIDANELNRASFFTEAATILGISQNFFLICTLILMYKTRSKFKQIVFLLFTLLYLLGGWFTGSRQVFFILLFTMIVSISYTILKGKFSAILIVAILTIITIFYIPNNNFFDKINYDSYSERYLNDIDGGNEVRMRAWERGVDQFSIEKFPHSLIGNGFTYTMGQQAKPGEKVGYHMESSVWAMFSECGYFSWYVFFWPLLYSFYLCLKMKNSFYKIIILCFLLSNVFIYFISPNGSHFLSTMSLFIIMGILRNNRSFFLIK